MGVTTKSWIYLALLVAAVLVAVDIWYVTNVLQARQVGYLLWEGGLAVLLLMIAAVLSFKFIPTDGKARTGVIAVLAFMVFEVLIMLNYATMTQFLEKLSFYFHLALTAATIILIGMVGNVAGIEKKPDEGFAVWIHSKDSPIPNNMIFPVWLAVFFAMGGLVMVSGTVLVQYPSFGVLPWLGGPSTSGFGVGDWENIVFMILPFAITYGLATWKKALPKPAAFVIALIVGVTSFGVYHSLVYSTNMIAMIIVLIFGGLSLASYYYTKSVVVMSALHVGNNFWGALFAVNVIGFSVFGITAPLSNILLSGILILAMGAAILFIIRRYGKKRRSYAR